MADYREISQEYARGAIQAAVLLNGAAATAGVTLVDVLGKAGLARTLVYAMIAWVAGTATAAATWVVGFLSTRYVDKSEVEKDASHLATSDRLMIAGVVMFIVSLSLFFAGCGLIILGYASANGVFATD